MSDWGWVSLAYGVVYATLGVYAVSLVRRTWAARRAVDSR
jgi:hypothetical protein